MYNIPHQEEEALMKDTALKVVLFPVMAFTFPIWGIAYYRSVIR